MASSKKEDQIYPKDVAKKYHFIEVYMKDQRKDKVVKSLKETPLPKRKNSLNKLLSDNYHDYSRGERDTSKMTISEVTQRYEEGGDSKMDSSIVTPNVNGSRTPVDGNDQLEKNLSKELAGGNQNRGRNNTLRGKNNSNVQRDASVNSSNRSKVGFNQIRADNFSREQSPNSNRSFNDCPKCRGKSSKQPCEDWVEILRNEFKDHINVLFRKKMQEFIEFIEEVVDVEDQIDVSKDHVIHTFYREHNTLQKMNENFRLLEYKRKKYLQAKKNSNSPPKSGITSTLTNPQKNFLTSIYGSMDNSAKKEQHERNAMAQTHG